MKRFILLTLATISCAQKSTTQLNWLGLTTVGHDYHLAGSVVPTTYYIPRINESDYYCGKDDLKSFKNMDGKNIGSACSEVYYQCLMQGTCEITEGDHKFILNYADTIGGIHRFEQINYKKCRYGYGVGYTCLVPYRTIAADLNRYKLGDVIYIPAVKGVRLPNGEIHDGFFVVSDRGGAIQGEGRFDFFTGFHDHRNSKNPFIKLGLTNKTSNFDFYLVSGEEAEKVLRKRKFLNPKVQIAIQDRLSQKRTL